MGGGAVIKNPPANAWDMSLIPGSGRSPGEGNGNLLSVFLPGKSHGQRSLADNIPWSHKKVGHDWAVERAPTPKHGKDPGELSFSPKWLKPSVYLFIFSFIFISWRLITLQCCSGFCHTLTWISHGFTGVPHPDPPSTSLSTRSLRVFSVHQAWALVSCIQPGLVIWETLTLNAKRMLVLWFGASKAGRQSTQRQKSRCLVSNYLLPCEEMMGQREVLTSRLVIQASQT